MKRYFKLCIYLLLFWIILINDVSTITIAIGILISLVIAYFSQKLLDSHEIKIPRVIVLLKYIYNLIKEVMLSSISHIGRIISTEDENIVEIDLYLEHESIFELVMMANFITLTPGTLALDVNTNHIKVIAITSKNKDKASVEKKLVELFTKIFK